MKTLLQNRLNDYIAHNEVKILDNANYIVQIGALTATVDETGKVSAHNAIYPTQFTLKAVKIITGMTWKLPDDRIIHPVVYLAKDWYKEQITNIKHTLSLLK